MANHLSVSCKSCRNLSDYGWPQKLGHNCHRRWVTRKIRLKLTDPHPLDYLLSLIASTLYWVMRCPCTMEMAIGHSMYPPCPMRCSFVCSCIIVFCDGMDETHYSWPQKNMNRRKPLLYLWSIHKVNIKWRQETVYPGCHRVIVHITALHLMCFMIFDTLIYSVQTSRLTLSSTCRSNVTMLIKQWKCQVN